MVGVVRDPSVVQLSPAASFMELYDRALTEVYSYLFSRLRDRPLSEDLTQEVFLAGARRAGSGQHVELPWLIAVARNKAVDHWREQARRERRVVLLDGAAPDEVDVAVDDVEEGETAEALAALNPTDRLALVLRHVDGLSVPEVAEHLGRTVAATEQILTRARASFRTAYRGARP